MRGTSFYLGMTEDHEAMWNRFEYNDASVQFRLAQMARVGVNNVRLWGSYRAFLRSRLMGSGPTYWSRVNDFLTMAHDLEIGTDLVLFNAAGYSGGGESIQLNQPHARPPYLSAYDWKTVKIVMPRSVLAGGVIGAASANPDWFTAWVGAPEEYWPGAKSDFVRLFRHKEYPGQTYPGAFLDATATAVPDFALDHLVQMNAAGVSTNKGLSILQVANEPPTFATAFAEPNPPNPPTFYGVNGSTWGDACFRLFNMLGSTATNPHSVGRSFGFKGLTDIVWRKNDNSGYWAFDIQNPKPDMLWTGFGPAAPPAGDHPIKALDRWVMHSSPDAYVHINDPALYADKAAPTLEAQFKYVREFPSARQTSPPTGFLQDLAEHNYVGDMTTWPPTKVEFRSTVAEEALGRVGVLQAATDFAHHLVPNPNWAATGTTRLGLSAWSLYASDASAADFTPLFLNSNYCIAPNDWEAFLDNWRRDVTRPKPASLQSYVVAGDDGTNTANALSDALHLDMATSPDRRVVVLVWADNFDPRVGHADYRGALPSSSGYPHAHKLFYRVLVGPGDGTYPTQLPAAWDATSAVLDQSPGPLVFDDSRPAVSIGSQGAATIAVDRPDPLIEQVLGPSTGHNANCCGGVVNAGNYSWIEHSELLESLGFYSVLRSNIMHWQKFRNPDVNLQPSIVFRKQDGQDYEFFVAWSRPVPKNGTGIANPTEKYYPEEDNGQTNSGHHQQYFVPFRVWNGQAGSNPVGHSIDASGSTWNYFKNEVLIASIRVNAGSTPSVTVPTKFVLPTLGAVEEWDVSNGNMQMPHAPTLSVPGASAIYPRIFASPEGHVAVVYLKSQDSWFDVASQGIGACGLCPGWATWLQNSRFHVYPWEMHAQVFIDGAGFSGAGIWMPQEIRISDEHPWGIAGWRNAMNARLPSPMTGQRSRIADFFPVVDPAAVLWQVDDALELRVSFKELITWIQPDNVVLYPHGYETMVGLCRIKNLSTTPELEYRSVHRMRVAQPPIEPLQEGDTPPPDTFSAKEIMFDTGESAIIRTPQFQPLFGNGVTAIAQNGNRLAVNIHAASSTENVATTATHYFGDMRVFASDFKAAAVDLPAVPPNPPEQLALIAYLYLHPASRATGGRITPEVSLRMWSRKSPLATNAEQTLEIRDATMNQPGGDLQSKILGLAYVGLDTSGTKRRFYVTWSQSGRIFRQEVSVHETTGALAREGALVVEAGSALSDVAVDFLHNSKLKGKADRFGVAFTAGRWIHYKAFP